MCICLAKSGPIQTVEMNKKKEEKSDASSIYLFLLIWLRGLENIHTCIGYIRLWFIHSLLSLIFVYTGSSSSYSPSSCSSSTSFYSFAFVRQTHRHMKQLDPFKTAAKFTVLMIWCGLHQLKKICDEKNEQKKINEKTFVQIDKQHSSHCSHKIAPKWISLSWSKATQEGNFGAMIFGWISFIPVEGSETRELLF